MLTDEEIEYLRQMSPFDRTRTLVEGRVGPFAGCGLVEPVPTLVHLFHLLYRRARAKSTPKGMLANATAWEAPATFASKVRAARASSRSLSEFGDRLARGLSQRLEALDDDARTWWLHSRALDWRRCKASLDDALLTFATVDKLHATIKFGNNKTEEEDAT